MEYFANFSYAFYVYNAILFIMYISCFIHIVYATPPQVLSTGFFSDFYSLYNAKKLYSLAFLSEYLAKRNTLVRALSEGLKSFKMEERTGYVIFLFHFILSNSSFSVPISGLRIVKFSLISFKRYQMSSSYLTLFHFIFFFCFHILEACVSNQHKIQNLIGFS